MSLRIIIKSRSAKYYVHDDWHDLQLSTITSNAKRSSTVIVRVFRHRVFYILYIYMYVERHACARTNSAVGNIRYLGIMKRLKVAITINKHSSFHSSPISLSLSYSIFLSISCLRASTFCARHRVRNKQKTLQNNTPQRYTLKTWEDVSHNFNQFNWTWWALWHRRGAHFTRDMTTQHHDDDDDVWGRTCTAHHQSEHWFYILYNKTKRIEWNIPRGLRIKSSKFYIYWAIDSRNCFRYHVNAAICRQ